MRVKKIDSALVVVTKELEGKNSHYPINPYFLSHTHSVTPKMNGNSQPSPSNSSTVGEGEIPRLEPTAEQLQLMQSYRLRTTAYRHVTSVGTKDEVREVCRQHGSFLHHAYADYTHKGRYHCKAASKYRCKYHIYAVRNVDGDGQFHLFETSEPHRHDNQVVPSGEAAVTRRGRRKRSSNGEEMADKMILAATAQILSAEGVEFDLGESVLNEITRHL